MHTKTLWLVGAALAAVAGLLWYLSRPGKVFAVGISGAPPVVPSSFVAGVTTPTIEARTGRDAF